MSFQKEISALFQRDLNRLIQNLEETDEKNLWKVPEGVVNSCGVLAQHLAGNLNHFVGTALGKTGYVRDREREFKNIRRPKEELTEDLRQLEKTIEKALNELNDAELGTKYPVAVPFESTIREFLIHLYGHLSYHSGQINYLRRILARKS